MGSPVAVDGVQSHHQLAVHEVLMLLQSDHRAGLDDEEAARRLQLYGLNALPQASSAGPLRRLVRQMHNPLIYVLMGAGAVTLFLREFVDASVIFGVVVVNTIVGFIQESKANSALDALRSMVSTEAEVIRGGRRQRIHSEQLVPGDLVLIEPGDKIPADLRLISATELQIDESALTGESLPVIKDEVVLPAATQVADRRNMAYSGTLVTGGTGLGIVVATAGGTELGEIHRLVGSAKTLATPLTRKLATFGAWLTAVILGLAAVTFAIGVVRGEPAADMFTAAVALAVGAIPEGLPAAVTITLAIGVSRMARRGAVIRRLPAVETLGSATVICSDKTGTLTENRMTVQAVWTVTQEVAVPAQPVDEPPCLDGLSDEAVRWCLLVGANCNDSTLTDGGAGLGDPTETAMLTVAQAYGVRPHALSRVDTLPFSSERRYMATTQVDPDSGARGAPGQGCGGARARPVRRSDDRRRFDGAPGRDGRAHRSGASRGTGHAGPRDRCGPRCRPGIPRTSGGGERARAHLHGSASDARPAARHGSRGRADLPHRRPPGQDDHRRPRRDRPVDRPADRAARRGHRVRGPELSGTGLSGPVGTVLSGEDLDLIDDDRLPEAVEKASVFARVSPAQKLRLVEALQARHHVVAMTGDGVNDAPALKQANIGVAMGLGGTEVAKDAGDMVLTDDDFATIESAVEEGRGVFDNLTKFIVWTLPTNMGEGMVILVAIILGANLPILPTQILWINMTTAVAFGLMLAWEPKEPGIMERPPRDPQKSLLTGPVVFRTFLVSALLVIGSWWVFDFELSHGASLEASRTAAVNLFVTVEAFYLFSCRSLTRTVWRTGFFTNRRLLVGVAVQAVGQAALTYLPAMNTLFHTAPIGWQTWLRILLVAIVAAVVVAFDKRRLRDRTL